MASKRGLTLGQAIKRLRLVSGLSQRELADRLDVDPTYLSHLEKDRREPSIKLLRALATELETPPGLLLAVALWSEMPADIGVEYEGLIEGLLELTRIRQLGLPLSANAHESDITE